MSKLQEVFEKQTFTKGTKVANLQGKNASDKEIAKASLGTKAYKAGGEFTNLVDAAFHAESTPAPQKAPGTSSHRKAEPPVRM